jgi:hypothetical protein
MNQPGQALGDPTQTAILEPGNVLLLPLVGTGDTGLETTPVELLRQTMKVTWHWARGLSVGRLLHSRHSLRMWWHTRRMAQAGLPEAAEASFQCLRKMVRKCDLCIVQLAGRMATHPQVFRRFLATRPEEAAEVVDALAWWWKSWK